MTLVKSFGEYRSLARRVQSETGISPFMQALEIMRLARTQGRIGPGDYYCYRLFERALSDRQKSEFVGWRAEARLDALNQRSWCCLGLDKVLTYSLLQSNDIRTPQTRAIYLPGAGRPFAGAIPLHTPEALHGWLREPSNYPFFSKPSASGFGRGAFWADRIDEAHDKVLFKDGQSVPVVEFAIQFQDHERLGYLFQTPIAPDRRLVGSLGQTVSSLRIMVLYDEHQGPFLHRAFWKLPTGRNTHDNYNGGLTGNLAAAIDLNTGRIVRVINGTGLDLIDVELHPDTGVELNTLAVPDWRQFVEFSFKAALIFPKLRFQQWDIALSDNGPTALEVNLFATGGCDLTQLLYRKGLLDDTMKSFLVRHSP